MPTAPKFLTLYFSLLAFTSCTSSPKGGEVPLIVTSNPALGSILHTVVGHAACQVRIRVINSGTEQHNFEVTPHMASEIQSAALLVLSGGGLDRWLVPSTPKNILMFEQLGVLRHFSTQKGHPVDPHFWLDPVHVSLYLDKVAHIIYKTFPQHCALQKLQENVSHFYLDVARLKEEVVKTVSSFGIQKVVATHDAFRYFIAFLERQGIVVQYRSFYELHVGSKQWIDLIQSLQHDDQTIVWDIPPFSTCLQLEAKLGQKILRCLRLDPSGNLLSQPPTGGVDYVQFYHAFLNGFLEK